MMEPALAKLAATSGERVRFSTRQGFSPMVSLMADVEYAGSLSLHRSSCVYSFSERFHAAFKALLIRSPSKRLLALNPSSIKTWHHLIYNGGCTPITRTANYQAEHLFRSMPCEETFPFRPPQLQPPPPTWMPNGLPQNYILLHASAAWRRKAWPAENWARVLDSLHAEGLGPFVLTGGNAVWERQLASRIKQSTRASLHDLSGQTTLQNYIGLVAAARMVLCIDGSAAHLAAAFKRPVVALFGPTSSDRWFYPSPTSVLVDARGFSREFKPPVDAIPIEAVTRATLNLWGSPNSRLV
jgi:ADP-heptose:LPS heptosyltransferase